MVKESTKCFKEKEIKHLFFSFINLIMLEYVKICLETETKIIFIIFADFLKFS